MSVSASLSPSASPSAPAGTLNLWHFHDIIDIGMEPSSGTGGMGVTKFTRASFYFDPSEYGGTCSFSFQIIANNSNGTDSTVTIEETASGTVVGSIVVPANTSDNPLIEGTFAPQVGLKSYYPNVPLGVKVFTGRVAIEQIGASKTVLWRPLMNGPDGGYSHFHHQ